MKVVVLLLLVFSIGINLSLLQQVEELEEKPSEISILHQEIELRDQQLAKYGTTEQWLMELGATSEQAMETIKASEVHNINPKY